MSTSGWRRRRIGFPATILTLAMAITTIAMADTFGPVHYDARTNQILVIIHYRGTNPHHHFTIQWGRCRKLHGHLHGPAPRAVSLGILDEQGNDAARRRYTKLVKIPLARMPCRPATVTLWTSPNQYRSINIP
jgi:hypothetical protein